MTAVVVLGPSGLALGRRLAAELPDAMLHGYAQRVADAAIRFDDMAGHLCRLFESGETIVAICASGIVIRSLAPLLADKRSEPPVVAVAEDGSVAVPLLGGHHGANDLARAIARLTRGIAAVTTAGDVSLGFALDDPPSGWRVANPAAAKAVAAALLARRPVRLQIEAAAADAAILFPSPLGGEGAGGEGSIRVTDRAISGDDRTLVLHPATLAIGIGCERGTSPEEVADLVRRCLAEAGLSVSSAAGVFSIALKAAEPAIHHVAQFLGVPARFFDARTLLAQTPRLSERSEIVFRETGCWGVAEGAALAAAGPDGMLIVPKRRSARATCAIARGPHIIDAPSLGRARGRLAIVGIGPGDAGGRTAEADAALRAAGDLVGYRLYLDLLGPLAQGKTRHDFDLGEEEDRVRAALSLAAAGRSVALISSGDAGIYAMASLVFELMEREADPDWMRIEVIGIPGVTAMQVAAARLGAPLGHDFCAISLSDLLTPWPVIEQRLRAAAAGDFVVALYNPVSRRRRTQLAAARDILLQARMPDTPAAIARNLGRAGEALRITTLAALGAAEVDMLSIVLVGSSSTRRVARPDGGEWLYTPRGYGGKAEAAT